MLRSVQTILHGSQPPSQRWRSTVLSRWGALGMRLHRSATAPPVTLAAGAAASLGGGSAANGKEAEASQQAQQQEDGAEEQQAQASQQGGQQEPQQQRSMRFSDVVKAAASLKAVGSAASLGTKPEDGSSIGEVEQGDSSSDADRSAHKHGSSAEFGAAGTAGAAHPATDDTAAAEAAAAAAAAAAEAGEAGSEVTPAPRPLPTVASFSALSVEGSQLSQGPTASPRQVGFSAATEAAGTAAPQHAKPAPRAQKSKLIRRCAGRRLLLMMFSMKLLWGLRFLHCLPDGLLALLFQPPCCRLHPSAPALPSSSGPFALAPLQHQHDQAGRPRGLAAGAGHLPGIPLLAGARQP